MVPDQLWPSLETKRIENLFTAGQLNGTSGYEEAAGQGIMAGINAALKVKGKEPLILDRSEAYIGVMVDDLVTKGTHEPYRLLTSRAEYRLLLRHDNADLRLTDKGYEIGLISEERYRRFMKKKEQIEQEKERFFNTKVKPDERTNRLLKQWGTQEIDNGVNLASLLRRPEIKYENLLELVPSDIQLSAEVTEQVEIQIKYEGYIKKQLQDVERLKKMEKKKLPINLDYENMQGLAKEARDKLGRIKPLNIGQAARISGVTPADISVLLIYLEHKSKVTS